MKSATGSKRGKTPMSPLTRSVGVGLRKSAEDARRIARMYGTRIWVIENGKLVGKKP